MRNRVVGEIKICKRSHSYPRSLDHCPDCKKERSNRWNLENQDYRRVAMAKWYINNKAEIKSKRTRHFQANKGSILQQQAAYVRRRKVRDPLFKLSTNLRALLDSSLRRKRYTKSSRTHELLGADFLTVQQHLIASAIRNYGKYFPKRKYQIDHIVPCAIATTEEELIALQHYTNLQYLTPADNRAKSDKQNWKISA